MCAFLRNSHGTHSTAQPNTVNKPTKYYVSRLTSSASQLQFVVVIKHPTHDPFWLKTTICLRLLRVASAFASYHLTPTVPDFHKNSATSATHSIPCLIDESCNTHDTIHWKCVSISSLLMNSQHCTCCWPDCSAAEPPPAHRQPPMKVRSHCPTACTALDTDNTESMDTRDDWNFGLSVESWVHKSS